MPRIFNSNATLPPMPKRIAGKADVKQALQRYVACVERAEHAELRGFHNGASVTGDRYRATAGNWQDKANAAMAAIQAWLEEV